MSGSMLCRRIGAAQIGCFAVVLCSLTMTVSCTTAMGRGDGARLRQTASLIEDVKAFGKTLGIEPTEALRRTSQEAPTLSMFWLWMQREGTLALNGPVDVHLAIGFNSERESPKLEQVYRVERYSVYHRQGNEFADGRSVATVEFAEEPLVRRVKVVLHEDLHGDVNFALPWEVEEALVTPLGSLAAVAYFRHKGDEKNLENSLTSVREERQLARELTALVGEAEKIFAKEKIDDAKQKIIDLLPNYPTYRRRFERQTRDQHAPTAVEAKLSHDLAYYRFYDQVAELAEKAPSLGGLIAELQRLPKDATPVTTERFLRGLLAKYGAVTN